MQNEGLISPSEFQSVLFPRKSIWPRCFSWERRHSEISASEISEISLSVDVKPLHIRHLALPFTKMAKLSHTL